MINRINTKIQNLVIHKMGDPTINTDIQFSQSVFTTDDIVLIDHFFKGCIDIFKEPLYHRFNTPALNENGNMVYSECEDVFTGQSPLYEASINIARHLYNASRNCNVKSSYFAMAHVSDLLIDDEIVDGIVLCKFDVQESLIYFDKKDTIWEMVMKYGYLPTKIDKVCLVLNANADEGYKVLNVDKTNPGGDAKYWKDTFLNISLTGNEYSYTSDYIALASNFLKKRKPIEEILEKGEEVEVLSRSKDYFLNNDRFEENDFKKEVFQDIRLMDAFDTFKDKWQEKTNRPLAQAFDLDGAALNKMQKVFKSVIKLDKNFHIYVHGDRSKILKGEDEDGKKYYILYYNEEIYS